MSDETIVPVCDCPECKTRVPVTINHMSHPDGRECDIAVCPACDACLNVEEDLEVEWVGLDVLEAMGWHKEEPLSDITAAIIVAVAIGLLCVLLDWRQGGLLWQ